MLDVWRDVRFVCGKSVGPRSSDRRLCPLAPGGHFLLVAQGSVRRGRLPYRYRCRYRLPAPATGTGTGTGERRRTGAVDGRWRLCWIVVSSTSSACLAVSALKTGRSSLASSCGRMRGGAPTTRSRCTRSRSEARENPTDATCSQTRSRNARGNSFVGVAY